MFEPLFILSVVVVPLGVNASVAVKIPWPLTPISPVSPLSPFAPFKFLKANANVRACSVPPGVTVTSGVPVLASTVAVTS